MGWTWRYSDSAGAVLSAEDLPAPTFPTQADAESWIGESWQELAAGGVDAVHLLEDGVVVYGPMSLRPVE